MKRLCENCHRPAPQRERVYRYRERDEKPCYEFWCEECAEQLGELDGDFPVKRAIHCPLIPGLN
jgi:hypothetical protein